MHKVNLLVLKEGILTPIFKKSDSSNPVVITEGFTVTRPPRDRPTVHASFVLTRGFLYQLNRESLVLTEFLLSAEEEDCCCKYNVVRLLSLV